MERRFDLTLERVMVSGKFLRASALGLVGAALAVPAGCMTNEFEGCAASRTCPAKKKAGEGGDNTEGSGGEGGARIDPGGGHSGSDTGHAGAGGGEEGGTAGAENDDDPPFVISFSPADGDVAVDRNVAITALLNEPLNTSTVTTASVTLGGPAGEAVGSVHATGAVVTFVPENALHLLGRYTFTIHNTVEDLAGNKLHENASADFDVRDGTWTAPSRPFGELVPFVATRFQRNEFGDVVLGVETWPTMSTAYGAIYHQASGQWSMLLQLLPSPGTGYVVHDVAIDSARRAAWTWGGDGDSGWSRARDVAFAEKVGAIGVAARLAVTPRGKATAISETPSIVSQTQDLSTGRVEQSVAVSPEVYFIAPVVSLESTGYIGVLPQAGREDLVFAWKTDSTWGEPVVLGSAAQIYPFKFDSDELGNIIVVWCQIDEIWARLYQREEDAWTEPMFVADVPPGATLGRPDISAGNAIVTFATFDPDPSTWAVIYQAGIGWIQSSLVRLDEPFSGSTIAAVIDPQGNALAAWHPSFRFRRFTRAAGWSEQSSLGERLNPYYMGAAAAPDGTVTVVANESDATGEGVLAPLMIRFE